MQGYYLEMKANEVVCREGDPSSDLFFLESGKLLICTITGTQVKALARISPGEFIGELSFFDGKPRASHIVTLEPSRLIQIPKSELQGHLPFWFLESGKNLTKKIRLLDEVVHQSNIRRIGAEDQKPLTIEEQRSLYSIITHQDSSVFWPGWPHTGTLMLLSGATLPAPCHISGPYPVSWVGILIATHRLGQQGG